MGSDGVVDNKPRVLSVIPDSPSMFRIRLRTMPLSSEMLKNQNHCLLSLRVLSDIKTHTTHKPTGPVLVTAKESEIEIEPDLEHSNYLMRQVFQSVG